MKLPEHAVVPRSVVPYTPITEAGMQAARALFEEPPGMGDFVRDEDLGHICGVIVERGQIVRPNIPVPAYLVELGNGKQVVMLREQTRLVARGDQWLARYRQALEAGQFTYMDAIAVRLEEWDEDELGEAGLWVA